MASSAPKTLETEESETPKTLASQSQASENQNQEVADQSNAPSDAEEGEGGEGEEEEVEDEGECGFCLFMKGGGCKESFIAWEKCVEEAEKNKEDVVDKCFQVTSLLKKCMDAHADYYEPILKAEKAAEEEAVKELERESSVVEKQEN